MSDGTPAQGKKNKDVHVRCRRCGEPSYHVKKERCSACGFGDSASRRDYQWTTKTGDN